MYNLIYTAEIIVKKTTQNLAKIYFFSMGFRSACISLEILKLNVQTQKYSNENIKSMLTLQQI